MSESNNLSTVPQHLMPICEDVGHNRIDHEHSARREDSADTLSMPAYEQWIDTPESPSTAEELTPLPFLLRMAPDDYSSLDEREA